MPKRASEIVLRLGIMAMVIPLALPCPVKRAYKQSLNIPLSEVPNSAQSPPTINGRNPMSHRSTLTVVSKKIPKEIFSGSILTTIIIDKQNNIVIKHVGGADYMSKGVVDLIKELLDE